MLPTGSAPWPPESGLNSAASRPDRPRQGAHSYAAAAMPLCRMRSRASTTQLPADRWQHLFPSSVERLDPTSIRWHAHRPRFSGHSGMRCATPGSGSTQVSTACAIPLHASHRRGVRYPHHQGAARSSASRSDHDLRPCRADGKIGLARRRQTQG